MLSPAGIYIHIPYCKQACTYCDFYFSTAPSTIPQTVNGIIEEAHLRSKELESINIQSIYLGGGTPSLLTANQLKSVFSALHQNYLTDRTIETTIETNPDDISEENLESWKKLGINRLSIGIQSFDDTELKAMNRAHNAKQAIQCVKKAQQAGFSNITIDLIYGTPWKNASMWKEQLQTVLTMNVPHVSAYQLTAEPKTKLTHLIQSGKIKSLDDEQAEEQFWIMKEVLSQGGIIQYEVSNFSKPGFEAIHNRSYWQGLPYLGLGPSAHSYNGNVRKWNHANLHNWYKAIKNNEVWWQDEFLSDSEKFNELILTRLRTRQGLDPAQTNALAPKLKNHFITELRRQIEKGNLEIWNGYIRIPESRVLLTDNICCELFFSS